MRFKRLLAALMVFALLLSCLPAVHGTQEDSTDPVSGHNIVILVDNGGSLRQGLTSDPEKYRHEAIRMLLDLLSNIGDNICTIAFTGNNTKNDDSNAAMRSQNKCFPEDGLMEITGPEDKAAIKQFLTDLGDPVGWTDIGTALLMAAERLDGMTKKNGKPSLIILFTDGETEFRKEAPESYYENSDKNQSKALEMIRDNGITLCAVYLDKDGKTNSSSVADLVRASITADADAAAAITLGELESSCRYHRITDASNLPTAFQKLYRLIGSSRMVALQRTDSFTVPSAGITDINICITTNGQHNIANTRIRSLTHSSTGPLDAAVLNSDETHFMGEKCYTVYKLSNLPQGSWTIDWTSPDPGAQCFLMVNSNLEARMSMVTEGKNIRYRAPIQISSNLYLHNNALTSSSDYAEYRCYLEVINEDTNETVSTVDLSLDSQGRFSGTYIPEHFGNFFMQAVYSCAGTVALCSEPIYFSINNNVPDVKKPSTAWISLSFGADGIKELDLNKYIKDAEHSIGELTIQPADTNEYLAENAFFISPGNETLTIHGRVGGNGTLRLLVKDPVGGTATLELRIRCVDLTVFIILLILVFVILVVYFLLRLLIASRKNMTVRGQVSFAIPITSKKLVILNLDAMECLNRNLHDILSCRTHRLIHIVSEDPTLRHNATALVKTFLSEQEAALKACRFIALPALRPGYNLYVCINGSKPASLENGTGQNVDLHGDACLKITKN